MDVNNVVLNDYQMFNEAEKAFNTVNLYANI